MVFSDAWALWFLLPLWAALAGLWFVALRLERRGRLTPSPTLAYPSVALAAQLQPSWRPRLRRLVQGLRLVTLVLLVLALARPQTVRGMRPASTEGIDIVLAIDTSGSMRALDLDRDKRIPERRTRLAVVKDVVAQFIGKRPNDQLGLVVFGAEAFVQCPLTLDHALVASFLERLEIGMAGDATAIGSGIGAAASRLERSQAKSKVIILLTDGINNTGPLSPKKAAEVAQALGIRAYTVAAGTRGQAPFLVDQPFLGQTVYYDDVSIDEDALREVAAITGGAYFRAEDSVGLAAIYDQIDKLEKTEIKARTLVDYEERARWFIAPALALLLSEVVLLGTRLRRLP